MFYGAKSTRGSRKEHENASVALTNQSNPPLNLRTRVQRVLPENEALGLANQIATILEQDKSKVVTTKKLMFRYTGVVPHIRA